MPIGYKNIIKSLFEKPTVSSKKHRKPMSTIVTQRNLQGTIKLPPKTDSSKSELPNKPIGRITIESAIDSVEHVHFLEYCKNCHYKFIDEITDVDYVAYKSMYSCSPEEIRSLKKSVSNSLVGMQNSNDFNINQTQIASPIDSSQDKINVPSVNDNEDIVKDGNCLAKSCESTVTSQFVENNSCPASVLNDANCQKEEHDGNLDELNLSVRSSNALRNAGIKTISQLFALDAEALCQIKNIGELSVKEIISAKERYSYNNFDIQLYSETPLLQNRKHLSAVLRSCIEDVLDQKQLQEHIVQHLSKEDSKIMNDTIISIGIAGNEIALAAYKYPAKIIPVINMLNVFSQQVSEEKELLDYFCCIPIYRLNNRLHPYIDSMNPASAKAVIIISSLLQNIVTVEDITGVFSEIKGYSQRDALTKLLSFLSLDVTGYMDNAISNVLVNDERAAHVLRSRCNNCTLQEIAEQIGVTRERVRQIESKAMRHLRARISKSGIDKIAFIGADLNDDEVLTLDEITNYMKGADNAPIIARLFKEDGFSKKYKYVVALNAFVKKDSSNNTANAFEAIRNLPVLIHSSDVKDILKRTSESKNIPLEMLEIEFDNMYKTSKNIRHKGSLSLLLVYDYILEKYYPSGIKPNNNAEMKQLREVICDVFGDIGISDNNRAICARIADFSILCDRGTYIHPKYVVIDESLLNEINNYISTNSRITISFNELFAEFKDKLLSSSNISNRYFLQGILRYRFGPSFYFTKDYISKEAGTSINTELEEFVLERGTVNKREIFERFAGITDMMLLTRMGATSNIIVLDNGYYMHASLLDIESEDYRIREIINEQIALVPVSSRKLLQTLWLTNPDFLTRNNISDSGKLFGVLHYMFCDEFTFSRPYLAPLGKSDLTNATVLLKHIEDCDEISVSELLNICEENQIRFLSNRAMINRLNKEFMRTDANKLQRIPLDEFDDDTIQAILNILIEDISHKGYLVASTIEDFTFYPNIPFKWTAFTLRSIVEKYLSDTIAVIEMPNTDTYSIASIFVEASSDIEGYEELLVHALKSENEKEPFKLIEDVTEWLKQEALISFGLPKFITDSAIISFDEFGKLIIE